jgi:hypothetical protein
MDQGQGNEEETRRLKREVLAFVLVEHPVRLTLGELQSALGRPDLVERAVAALVADELLAREADDVLPTPAAIHFNQLEPIEPPTDA